MDKEEQNKITKSLKEALSDVFGTHIKAKRFIDVTRIPLLCKSVIETNQSLKEIKGDVKSVKKSLNDHVEDFNDHLKEFNNHVKESDGQRMIDSMVRKIVFGAVKIILATTLLGLLGFLIGKGSGII